MNMTSDSATGGSPSSSNSSPKPTSSAPGLKRPSRKSTLTQQQKNQKRQRATQDQLATLEVEFNKNPTPTAVVRERIAEEINMTERSVQIWFQNRRAKIKLMAKRSLETGEECDSIPESMRQYLAFQAMESSKALGRSLPIRGAEGINPYRGSEMFLGESHNPTKTVIDHMSCRAISIGSWRRVGVNAMDLVVFYSPEKACMTYYINNDSAGYKIEYPFSYIKHIFLDHGEIGPNGQPSVHRPGGLVIELTRPPNFFMDSSGSGGFYQCGDFTEDQQASHVLLHHLGGHPKVLMGQLAKLEALDSFQNRHAVYDRVALPASAPVSPGLHRPASQPNHHSRPQVGMPQERHFGTHLHPGPTRGHKRQRSRSVPDPVDFAALQMHMTSLPFLQEHGIASPHAPSFSPMPPHNEQPGFEPMGPNLRIDTSSYGLDFRQYPLSAATTASPIDHPSPRMFTSVPLEAPIPNYHTPYSLPFLSPLVDSSALGPSASPLSMVSAGDPVIANQSPPLSALDRSASAELFALPDDSSAMADDSLSLTDLYSKQSLGMPMHSPGVECAAEELAMHSMMTFDAVDPSSLSPEN